MGASAMMIATIASSAASTAATVVGAQNQKAVVKAQRDEAIRQNAMETREAEINRLEQMRNDLANNMLAASISGTQGGTQQDIISGNITKAEEDVNYIQTWGKANAANINTSADMQINSLNNSQLMGIASGVASGAAGVYQAKEINKLKASLLKK